MNKETTHQLSNCRWGIRMQEEATRGLAEEEYLSWVSTCPRLRVGAINFNPHSATSGPPLPLRGPTLSSVKRVGQMTTGAEHPYHGRRLPPPGTLNPQGASCLHLTGGETEEAEEREEAWSAGVGGELLCHSREHQPGA